MKAKESEEDEDERSGLSDVDSVRGHHWRDEMDENGEDSVTDRRYREEKATPHTHHRPEASPTSRQPRHQSGSAPTRTANFEPGSMNANTEMVGQLIEATKDNARNARKAREAAKGTQEAANGIRGRISNIEEILTEPEPEQTETLSHTSEHATDGVNGPPREREGKTGRADRQQDPGGTGGERGEQP